MGVKTFLKRAVKACLPYGIVCVLRQVRQQRFAKMGYGNTGKSYCPVCQKQVYFIPFGFPPRAKAACPYCGSVERHRLLWLFLQRKTDIFKRTNGKILHVAAEPCFEKRLKKTHKVNYITADLNNPNAMVKMDITNIQYPEESFDIIICNHVLEHVNDDKKAMGEFYRVLKKGCWAILLVPMADIEKTYEDSTITSEGERFWAYGQGDHVRKYGKDYADRLKSVGFNVEKFSRNELVSNEEIETMCLKEDSETWGFMGGNAPKQLTHKSK